MNKKGILGLNTTTEFIVAVLVLAVTAFAVIIALSVLGDTDVARIKTEVGITNETTTIMNNTVPYELSGTSGLTNCVATIQTVLNNTAPFVNINSANFTVSGCTVTAIDDPATFNETSWLLSGSYTHESSAKVDSITNNVSIGIASFFGNATTWFSLLAIVVILLIIAIVIVTVRRFEVGAGGGAGGFVSSGGSEQL